MSGRSRPLRFLAALVGGWAALRAAMLAPLWPDGTIEPPSLPSQEPSREAAGIVALPAPVPTPLRARPVLPIRTVSSPGPGPAQAKPGPARPMSGLPEPSGPIEAAFFPIRLPAPPPRSHSAASRWSLSAWALLRRGDAATLASAGTLGGSQVGARLVYRLNGSAARPLSLSARLSARAGGLDGAEAALGLDWQPVRSLPLRLLAERRQALGKEGRSAFALLAYGGLHDRPVAARFRLDAYAQGGIVGTRSRDLFADGAARLSRALDEDGRIRLGAGAWAAAQPGIARLDAGPHASLRLPGITLALDWRVRLAGDAAPRSGPTATLSTDF